MAKGYKRDSRGRFAGGYGAGALGGKGAYASRPNSGKGSRGARGATSRLQQPRAVRARKKAGKAYSIVAGKKGSGERIATNIALGTLAGGVTVGALSTRGGRLPGDKAIIASAALMTTSIAASNTANILAAKKAKKVRAARRR